MRKRPVTESRPVLHAPPPPSPSEMDRLERAREPEAKPERGIAVIDFFV
ncbi:MAG TPA: hypothetical protein VMW52_11510 [Phycisphaerae bacterium]|nr:hypothetical protein [Phycisphaerae bacterium]